MTNTTTVPSPPVSSAHISPPGTGTISSVRPTYWGGRGPSQAHIRQPLWMVSRNGAPPESLLFTARARASATVIALILTTVMPPIMPGWSAGLAADRPRQPGPGSTDALTRP